MNDLTKTELRWLRILAIAPETHWYSRIPKTLTALTQKGYAQLQPGQKSGLLRFVITSKGSAALAPTPEPCPVCEESASRYGVYPSYCDYCGAVR